MSKIRKLRDDNVFNLKDNIPIIKYTKLFSLLDRYQISHNDFYELSHVSTATLQRLRKKDNTKVKMITLIKILNGLNKLNQNKHHTLNDIITVSYKNI